MNDTLAEAFDYSAWASRELVAACRDLSEEQLNRPLRGYGSILATLGHIAASDAAYVAAVRGFASEVANDGGDPDDLDAVEALVARVEREWKQLLSGPLDVERQLLLDSGTYKCSVGVVLVQAIQHAAAHREQVRGGLSALGARPPDIQPWAWAGATGRSGAPD